MIDALIHGRLIRATTEAGRFDGRIVIEPDTPITITARRGAIKSQLLALPHNCPLSVAGRLSTSIGHGKSGPHVVHHLEVHSILTAQPSFLRRLARYFIGE